MLDAVAKLSEDVCRDVLRRVSDEEHTDALRADQPDGPLDGVEECPRGVIEEQVGLVEEEDQLGLVELADLGQGSSGCGLTGEGSGGARLSSRTARGRPAKA
jgi:hypothetical protein